MAVTPSSFKAQYPEFATLTDQQVQTWIDQSDAFFDAGRWDDLLDLGVSLWVAHQLKSSQLDAQLPDDTTMQKEGDVQFQRDAQMVNKIADNPYMSTNYGRKYLYYMRFVGAGGVAL